jgi:hypothetical protein
MKTFLAKVVDIRNAGAADKNLVGPVFIAELRSIALARFLGGQRQ